MRGAIITRRAIRVVLLVAALLLARNYILRVTRPAPPALPAPVRSSFAIPSDRALDEFTVSADGHWIAYSAEGAGGQLHLFLRSVDGSGEREIAGATGARHPFFAADGSAIGYFAGGAIWRVTMAPGGSPVNVCDAPDASAGGAWTDDGRIVFAPLGGAGLMAVPAAGGVPSAITTLSAREEELAHGWPQALPKGAIVFTVSQKGRDAHLETLSAAGVRARMRMPAVGQAAYASTGQLVYSYLGDLLAVPFDADELATRGVPVTLVKGVQSSGEFDQLGHAGFAMSRTGTLAWLPAGAQDQRRSLVRVALGGAVAPLGGPAGTYQTPRLSPDGRRLAVTIRSGMMTRDIRVLDATHPDRVLFTIEGGDSQSPAWMPDGRLTYASNREGPQKIYIVKNKGDAPKPLFSMDVQSPRNPASWWGAQAQRGSRVGVPGVRRPPLLAFYEIDQFRSRDVMVYRVGEAVLPVAATNANERSPWLAPDGRSIAYVSDASGRDEVYVKRLDDQSPARQVSQAGGAEPVWARAGLFYREGERLLLDGKVLFEGRFEHDPGGNAAAYDVDPNGKFLVMLKSAWQPAEIRVMSSSASPARAGSTDGR